MRIVLFYLLVFVSQVSAVNRVSTGSGNWNTAATWSPAGVPGTADDVTILLGHTIVMNQNGARCLSLTINGTARWNNSFSTRAGVGGIVISATGDVAGNAAGRLNCQGNLNINSILSSNTVRIRMQTNSNLTITGTGSMAWLSIRRSTTNNGNITVRNILDGNNTLTNGANATLNFGGASMAISNLVANAAGNTVNYNGAAAQTIYSINYYNLSITKPSGIVADLNSNTTVSNNITVASGTFRVPNFTLTCNGTTSVSGILLITNTGGTKTFNNVIVNNTGTWNSNVAENYTLNGNLQNDGTFTANNGIYTLAGGAKTISGTSAISIPNITCTGSYTNNANLTVTSSLIGGGSFSQGTTGILHLIITNANFSVNAFNASAVGNLVEYALAANQNIRVPNSGSYHHLTAAGTGTKTLIGGTVINGNLIISSTLDVGAPNFAITLGGNWTNTGTFTARSGTVTLNGITTQTITNATGETFFNLIASGSGTKQLGGNITMNNDLTINSTLDVSVSSFAINLRRNWINNGIFTSQNGTVSLNGAVAQSIGGSAVSTFRNLTLNNAAGASLASDENIKGTLSLTLGTFTTTGRNFTLISDALGTARIGTIVSGNITGNITMQRYIPPGPTSWRMLSTPVAGLTLNDWKDDFIMSGFPGSQYPTFGFISEYTYDETVLGPKDFGYIAATNITNSIIPKKGYYCYIGPVPLTMDVTGAPAKFGQAFTLTYTASAGAAEDGWNMVGNPYPSSIDWDAAGWTKTRVNNAIYVWNPNLQQYASYVAFVGTNGGTKNIPSSQAFWVQANAAAPALTCSETVKTPVDQAFMKMSNNFAFYYLKLSMNGNAFKDETFIRFEQTATSSFDQNLDAYKIFSTSTQVPHLSTLSLGVDMSINSMPLITSNVSIPLRAKVGVKGTYTISRDSLLNMPTSCCIVLQDLLTGAKTDLRATPSYTFYISDTTKAPRFLIRVGAPIYTLSVSANCNGSSDGMAIAKGAGAGPWDYEWLDSTSKTIKKTLNSSVSDTLFNLSAGTYYIKITDPNSICGVITDSVVIQEPQAINANVAKTNANCNGANDGFASVNPSGGAPPYTFLWSNGSTGITANNLSAGIYIVRITDNNACVINDSAIIAQPKPMKALFAVNNDTVYLKTGGTVMLNNISIGALSFQWNYGDGSAIDTSKNPLSHAYTSAGTYVIQLKVSNTSCYDSLFMNIVVLDSVMTGIKKHEANIPKTNIQQDENGTYVCFNYSNFTDVTISILNSLGQNVAKDVNMNVMNAKVKLDLPELAGGVYYVRVFANKVKQEILRFEY